MPATARSTAERPSDRLKRVVGARAAFRAISVSWAPQEDFMAAAEEVRLLALEAPGEQQTAIQLISKIGTGKTRGAKRFIANLLAREEHADGTIPAALARLDGTGTTASVPTAILRALGAPRPDHGTEELRWLRARSAIRERRTGLVFFDECNRLNRRPTVSPIIADNFREFLDEGLVGLAFLGTEEATKMFARCPALVDRLDAPVAMDPIDWLIDADRDAVTEFADRLDHAIVGAGLLTRRIGLKNPDVLQPLVEAGAGTLRRICGVIERAVCASIGDHTTRVTRADLADAVDAWLMPKGLLDHNPFSERS